MKALCDLSVIADDDPGLQVKAFWRMRRCVKAYVAAAWLRNSAFECANLVVWFESVAQLVEHRPFKALVLGSSPSALTINITFQRYTKMFAVGVTCL
jgi:hypothetical protein